MNQWVPILLIINLLISFVPQQSHASLVNFVRKLAQPHNPITDSPSPSPVPSANLKSEGSLNSPEPEGVKACDVASSDRCKINEYNITACVPSAGNGLRVRGGSFLLIVNDGERSLKLNISVSPANETRENIVVLGHKVEKVNITSNIGRSSSISVNAEKGICIIQLGASVPQASYTVYLTPVNATYVLFVTVLFVGGTLACCKLVNRERHLDGVPYRELEMGHQESDFSLNVGPTEGWEESWEDDWDEEKAVQLN